MIAWVGAAPSGSRKRAVSTVEHMDQPSKKVKSTASKPIKSTAATQRGQSVAYIYIYLYLLTNTTL